MLLRSRSSVPVHGFLFCFFFFSDCGLCLGLVNISNWTPGGFWRVAKWTFFVVINFLESFLSSDISFAKHDFKMLSVMSFWLKGASVDMKRRRDELYRHDIDFPLSMSICPVCGTSVSKEDIGIHVEDHFTQPSTSDESNGLGCLEGNVNMMSRIYLSSLLKASSDLTGPFARVYLFVCVYTGSVFYLHWVICCRFVAVSGISNSTEYRACNYGKCQQMGNVYIPFPFILYSKT